MIESISSTILGHDPALNILRGALSRPAQAYLFIGPDAVGKRTCGLWLARLLLCDTAHDGPCGRCSACHKVLAGSHPDIVFISPPEKKQSIGVEQVRSLQQSARFAPIEGRHKIFVLAQAERLTEQAANCLLKSLEEPQPNRVFILCAPSQAALLPTVVSRCQVIRLSPVPGAALAGWLVENGVERDRAALAATLSEGRPGQALRLARDNKVWEYRETVLGYAERLATADGHDVMEMAEKLEPNRGGTDDKRQAIERALEMFGGWFRDVSCLKAGVDEAQLINRDRAEALRVAAGRYTQQRAVEALRSLQEAREHMAANVNPRLLFARLLLHLKA
jgi:DNA polymerase-3 subunit delta'